MRNWLSAKSYDKKLTPLQETTTILAVLRIWSLKSAKVQLASTEELYLYS